MRPEFGRYRIVRYRPFALAVYFLPFLPFLPFFAFFAIVVASLLWSLSSLLGRLFDGRRLGDEGGLQER